MTTNPEPRITNPDLGASTGTSEPKTEIDRRPPGPTVRVLLGGIVLALAAPTATPLGPSDSLTQASVTAPRTVAAVQDETPELDLVELMNLSWREGKRLPKRYRNLDGLTVRVQGYMALGTPEGIESFQLTSDACGCAGQIELTHFVEVTLTDDLTSYRADYLDLTGTMSVGIEYDEDGFATSLFRLEIERVE